MRPGSQSPLNSASTVSMFPSVVCLGKLAVQLPDRNQLEVNVPVQSVWAWVETVDAAKSAMVASDLDKWT